MEITGKIIEILEPVTGQGKNGIWKKQEVVTESSGQYPKKVCIAFWGDNADSPLLQVGNEITSHIDVESREYNGRWYTEVKAWKVDVLNEAGSQTAAPTPPADFIMPDEDENALPF